MAMIFERPRLCWLNFHVDQCAAAGHASQGRCLHAGHSRYARCAMTLSALTISVTVPSLSSKRQGARSVNRPDRRLHPTNGQIITLHLQCGSHPRRRSVLEHQNWVAGCPGWVEFSPGFDPCRALAPISLHCCGGSRLSWHKFGQRDYELYSVKGSACQRSHCHRYLRK